MKKLFAFVLVFAIAFAFSSCKSADKKTVTTKPEIIKETETTAEPNLFKSIDKSEAEKIAGAEISVPKKFGNISYNLYSDDKGSYVQTSFSQNNFNFVYRIKRTDKFEDFSGLYFTWSDIEKVKIGESEAEFRQYSEDEDSFSILLWIDESNGTMNTLSVDDAVDAELLVSIAEKI